MKGILENIRKQREEHRHSAHWLHNSISYDTGCYLEEKHKKLSKQLFNSLGFQDRYKQEQKLKDFETLLANLFYQNRKPVNVSLNQDDWKHTQYNNCSYFTVAIIHKLLELQYISMVKGYNFKEGSKMTRIWATDKLLKIFPEYNTGVGWKPVEVVILKDDKGKLIEYKDTIETRRVRSILLNVNRVNNQADIRYQKFKINASLMAIFRKKFTLYGRLHTKGYSHLQGFSGDEREEITINGESVIELDYSGLHPNLLYASEGIQFSGDPYSIVDKRLEVRPFLKQILLCMLNSKDVVTAEKAANFWLRYNHAEREQLKTIGITKARPFIDKFFEAHKPIAKYFCNGKDTGLRIMNKDSKIALDIINHFAKQNIPILAIHDSFIVQEKYKDELAMIMRKTYSKHTGGFRIGIK